MTSIEKEVIPIIYWTTWFGTEQWQDYTIADCDLPVTCKITHDRSKATNSSVLLFHASDLDKTTTFPPRRKDQAWVYHNAEAPKYHHGAFIDQMQYSMTYRLDSDFPWGYFDGSLLKRMTQKPVPIKTQKAPIAWIVSNCKASNYRHHFVKELSKYIDIDIYGHCMNNKVFPENKTTIEVIQDYHFYLALENSNCKDYVTEKLYHAYVAGSIPIVDGPSDYGPFIPNTHAVIRVDDFEHPKSLAAYIQHVLSDKETYDRYFDYKKEGGITNKQFISMLEAYDKGQCKLCQLAYERHTNTPIAFYPGKKIYPDNTCIDAKHKHSNSTFIILALLLCFFLFVLFKVKRNGYALIQTTLQRLKK